ncbi:envelope stress response membrane protein PspB [Thermaurantiacus sp.]
MDAADILVPLAAIFAIFLGMPWLVFHYVTKWKQAKAITVEDEDLLDELHDLARRLDERLTVLERIHAADRALEPPAEPTRIAAIRPHPIGKDV